jgi:hypothetical protein
MTLADLTRTKPPDNSPTTPLPPGVLNQHLRITAMALYRSPKLYVYTETINVDLEQSKYTVSSNVAMHLFVCLLKTEEWANWRM